jgi:hypothetical protein
MKVYSVAVTTQAPRDANDPGMVALGYYVLENVDGHRMLRMTDEAGATVEINGQQWIRELGPGNNPKKLAGQLTMSIRIAATEDERGFHRRLGPEDYWPVPA